MKIFDRKSSQEVNEKGERVTVETTKLGCGFYALLGLLALACIFIFGNGTTVVLVSAMLFLFLILLLS